MLAHRTRLQQLLGTCSPQAVRLQRCRARRRRRLRLTPAFIVTL